MHRFRLRRRGRPLPILERERQRADVENVATADVYERLASIYDLVFGPILQPGRVRALKRLGIQRGDRVLEVGVGTGLSACLYPPDCAVTGIDVTGAVLEKARDRIARHGICNVRLVQMDAADLKFADGIFDIVYAAYLVSVVPDPIAVVREMRRVCRPGGRIVILNHFRSSNTLLAWIERAISPCTARLGFKSDLDLRRLLLQTELKVWSIERVNLPRIWSLVTCVNEA